MLSERDDPSPASKTAAVYGKDVGGIVEICVVDENGTASQLTHHNADKKVVDFSFNEREGWAEYIDLNGLVEAVEALTGKIFKLRINWENPGNKRELMRSLLEKANKSD